MEMERGRWMQGRVTQEQMRPDKEFNMNEKDREIRSDFYDFHGCLLLLVDEQECHSPNMGRTGTFWILSGDKEEITNLIWISLCMIQVWSTERSLP